MQNFVIGCDPELFCFDTVAGEYVSADPFIPGTKAEPYLVTDGALQLDGTACELNIDPTDDADVFVNRLFNVVQAANSFLPEHVELRARPTVNYYLSYYNGLPDSCKILGCDPDRSAYNRGQLNPIPQITTLGRVFGGGHIHVGWTSDQSGTNRLHKELCMGLVKQMDYYVGLQMTVWDAGDEDPRVQHYGKAGNFRVKPYGVEYRTPSNIWVGDPNKAKRIHELSMLAATRFRDGECLDGDYRGLARELIDTSNTEEAEGLLDAIL